MFWTKVEIWQILCMHSENLTKNDLTCACIHLTYYQPKVEMWPILCTCSRNQLQWHRFLIYTSQTSDKTKEKNSKYKWKKLITFYWQSRLKWQKLGRWYYSWLSELTKLIRQSSNPKWHVLNESRNMADFVHAQWKFDQKWSYLCLYSSYSKLSMMKLTWC